MILAPMAANGQEPVGSMGTDTPLAVLSDRPKLLFNYFKQLFAQVTNPPIDPLREGLVMSLMSFTGKQRNLLDETPRALPAAEAAAPDPDQRGHGAAARRSGATISRWSTLPALFDADAADPARGACAEALDALVAAAEQAIRRRGVAADPQRPRRVRRRKAPIPSPAGHRGACTTACSTRRLRQRGRASSSRAASRAR